MVHNSAEKASLNLQLLSQELHQDFRCFKYPQVIVGCHVGLQGLRVERQGCFNALALDFKKKRKKKVRPQSRGRECSLQKSN